MFWEINSQSALTVLKEGLELQTIFLVQKLNEIRPIEPRNGHIWLVLPSYHGFLASSLFSYKLLLVPLSLSDYSESSDSICFA